MKRYFLFSGKLYHPRGGLNDFLGSFHTIKECELSIMLRSYNDWHQVYDTIECKMVIDACYHLR
jgi:hypothetical protein